MNANEKTPWYAVTPTNGEDEFTKGNKCFMGALAELRRTDTMPFWACTLSEYDAAIARTILVDVYFDFDRLGLGRDDIDWTGFDTLDE